MGVSLALQLTHDSASHHTTMPSYVYFRIFIHTRCFISPMPYGQEISLISLARYTRSKYSVRRNWLATKNSLLFVVVAAVIFYSPVRLRPVIGVMTGAHYRTLLMFFTSPHSLTKFLSPFGRTIISYLPSVERLFRGGPDGLITTAASRLIL